MIKKIAVLLVVSLALAVSPALQASPAQASYPEQCAEALHQAGQTGRFSEVCAPIQSPEAVRCISAIILSPYIAEVSGYFVDFRLPHSKFNACGEVTSAASRTVDLMLAKHPDVSSDVIRIVGHVTAPQRLACFAKVVAKDDADLDEDTVLKVCP